MRSDLLKCRSADVWDSGKQRSGESTGVHYGGQTVESGRRDYWTVRVWDGKGRAAEAAEPVWSEMGLLREIRWEWNGFAGKIRMSRQMSPAFPWIWVQVQHFSKLRPGTEAVFHLDVDLSGYRDEPLFVDCTWGLEGEG
ncbi:MAG: hypothetical protein ACJ74Z_22010 [Bryobacteraceae bacterium]